MAFLLSFIVVIAVLVIPLKMAASIADAKRRDVFSCIAAMIVAGAIQLTAARLIPNVSQNMGILLSLPLTAVGYMLILGTTFFKAVGIAILQIVFLIAGVYLLRILLAMY